MSFLDKLASKLPIPHKEENKEYFFALNIGPQRIKSCIWVMDGNHLKVLNTASKNYSSSAELLQVADSLLDRVLGTLAIEPEKILFGVPDSWLQDDDLKPEYTKTLRDLVKALEVKPLAYVATSHALTHFLEKSGGAPVTAILVGIDNDSATVTVSRGGKVDGARSVKREQRLGEDVEKVLLTYSDIEVLPSRILIYGDPENLAKQKQELASFPWMSKLSFLHLPKIEILEDDIDIKAVSFAGAVELNPNVKYVAEKEENLTSGHVHPVGVVQDEVLAEEAPNIAEVDDKTAEDLGFVSGDVTKSIKEEKAEAVNLETDLLEDLPEEETAVPSSHGAVLAPQRKLPLDEYETGLIDGSSPPSKSRLPSFSFPSINKLGLLIPIIVLILLGLVYIFIPTATVTIFVEPRVLQNDTEVVADPGITQVDEAGKKIPGSYVETQVTGSDKISTTGKKQVGDPAKGTIVVYNKTNSSKTFSKGTVLTSQGGIKFTLDNDVKVASQSATEEGISFGKANATVAASDIGADGNLASGTTFTLSGAGANDASAKAEGNFSGGTSKDVTVVTDADQKKLLANLTASLKGQASEQLQAKLQSSENNGSKKILEEALSEEITKKTFTKKVGDQASEVTLNMTVNYKGLAYSETDLKSIVGKLVETNIPDGFELDLAQTETSSAVSKVEKDKLTFLARFKAKLIPKLDKAKIAKQIVGKTPSQVADIVKSYENVLGSDIKLNPPLPAPLARLPFLEKNIKVEVGLK